MILEILTFLKNTSSLNLLTGLTYSFTEEHPARMLSAYVCVTLLKSKPHGFFEKICKAGKCFLRKSTTFQSTISLNSFIIFSRFSKSLTNIFFSIVIFEAVKQTWEKYIIFTGNKGIAKGMLIDHWGIFSGNPINVVKNFYSSLFFPKYSACFQFCFHISIMASFLKQINGNVDIFKFKMYGFYLTKTSRHTVYSKKY